MSFRPFLLGAAAVAACCLTGPVSAASGRAHRHRAFQAERARVPRSGGYEGSYGAAGWEAAVNARRTAQAYREPGLTQELAPDSRQTATGGPSGGVPGFSGH